MSSVPTSSVVTPRISRQRSVPPSAPRKRPAISRIDLDDASDEDVPIAPWPPGMCTDDASEEIYRRLDKTQRKLNDAYYQVSQLAQMGLTVAAVAEKLSVQVDELKHANERIEFALQQTFAAMLAAKGIECAANCGCDPTKEPLLKLSNCSHHVCTSFLTGQLLCTRTTLSIGAGISSLTVKCPQCREIGKPTVDASLLPISGSNLVGDGELYNHRVPDDCRVLREFVNSMQ